MRVYMDDLGSMLLGLHNIGKPDRMGLGHVAADDQNSIAINEVLRKCRGTATAQRCTQTGYSGAVSYTGLVLNRDDAKSSAEELLHQIILFNVQRCSTQGGDSQRMVHLASIG